MSKLRRQVELATEDDVQSWLHLAVQVEPLFGPLIATGFEDRLRANIGRDSAFCVRSPTRPVLSGGIIFDARKAPTYHISWLAVAQDERRQGVGAVLLEYCLALADVRCVVRVITFGPENPGGEAARGLYVRFGFRARAEVITTPEGPRQEFILTRGVVGA